MLTVSFIASTHVCNTFEPNINTNAKLRIPKNAYVTQMEYEFNPETVDRQRVISGYYDENPALFE
jgi:hypothetical protein